jgi:hypothetical protein
MTNFVQSGGSSSNALEPPPHLDDTLTIIAISVLAAILSNVLHEGVGHGMTALLTGARSGVVSTVAWSSDYDSHIVQAGGTLVNIVAGLLFWIALRGRPKASPWLRYFLLLGCAFNLFTGTGYFFFSGVSNFGDWAQVIAGLSHHGLWRALLVVVGATSYYGAVRLVGTSLVRYVGIPRSQPSRLRKLMMLPYFTSILLACGSALLNPFGLHLVWQSALPATMGGGSGLLWLQYYIPKDAAPQRTPQSIGRNYPWIATAIVLGTTYVAIFGPGLTLRR